MLAEVLKGFSDPLGILDSFLCLAAVGVLLGIVRLLTGNIAACIGLHAGWVAVIYVVRETTVPNLASPAAWLMGDYDGFIGWMVLAWTRRHRRRHLLVVRPPENGNQKGTVYFPSRQIDLSPFDTAFLARGTRLSSASSRATGSSSSSNACLSLSAIGSSSVRRAPTQAASSNFFSTC